jgi:hypothetical protein
MDPEVNNGIYYEERLLLCRNDNDEDGDGDGDGDGW